MLNLFSILIVFVLAGCTSGPKQKELVYNGENIEKVTEHGVVLGNIHVPKDSFPNDNRKTDITFRNLDTKQEFNFLKTDGPFVMKLPPGNYMLADFWDGGTCQTSAATSVGGVVFSVPLDLSSLRKKVETANKTPLVFTIKKSAKTNIGEILPTCFEWNFTEKMTRDFDTYIKKGNYEAYVLPSFDKQICNCHMLQKKDVESLNSANQTVNDFLIKK